MRRRLPERPFGLATGVDEKTDPHKVDGGFLSASTNWDGYEEFGSWGRTYGSLRKSRKAPGAWSWLTYFQRFDLGGRLRREKIGAAAGTVYRIEASTDLTKLHEGLTADFLTSAQMLDKLYFTSPKNDPLKYDGSTVTRWGIRAPGREETVLDAISNDALWAANGTNGVASADISIDGKAALEVRKTDLSTALLEVTKSYGSALNFESGDGFGNVWLHLPAGALAKLRSATSAVEVSLTEGANENVYRFLLGDLFDGWNRLRFDLDVPDVDGGADLMSVDQVKLSLFFASSGHAQSGIVWDHLFLFDSGAVTPVLSGSGLVTGKVTYRVVYVSRYGRHSNAGTASAQVNAALGSKVQLKSLPISSDPQVTARRIYRDLNGDGVWRFVAQVDDNVTATYLDNVQTPSTETPALAGDAVKDHSPPRRMLQVVAWKDHFIGIDAENRFQLNISNRFDGEYWPLVRQRQFEREFTALTRHAAGLLCHSSDGNLILTGDTYDSFRFDEVNPDQSVGCTGFRAWAPTKRYVGVMHDDGPYLIDAGLGDPWFLGSRILPTILGWDVTAFDSVHWTHDRGRYQIWIFAKGQGSSTYNRVAVFQYGVTPGDIPSIGRGRDPHDLRVGAWTFMELPASVDPRVSAIVEDDPDRPELWVGGGDGFVYHLGDATANTWAVGMGRQAIAASFVTGWTRLSGEGETGYPRFLELNAFSSVQTTLTCEVHVTDEPDESGFETSGPLRIDIGPGGTETSRSLRPMIGEWARVSVSHSDAAARPRIRSVSVTTVPRRRRVEG